MRKLALALALLCAPLLWGTAKSSKKANIPGGGDGHYVGGIGSSHKGGKYLNPMTGNHERNRQAGVSKFPAYKSPAASKYHPSKFKTRKFKPAKEAR